MSSIAAGGNAAPHRWTSECTGCRRPDVEVEPRSSHGERVLCDDCAAKPYSMPRWTAADDRREQEFQLDQRARRDRSSERMPSLEKVAKLLGLDDDRFVRVWRPTAAADAPLTAETATNRRLRWERQADMLKPRELAFPALAAGFGPVRVLSGKQAQDIYRALVGACETLETEDALDEAREWIDGFLGICSISSIAPTFDAVLTFSMWQDFRDAPRLAREPTASWCPLLLADVVHRYVRRADLATFVRDAHHKTISYSALAARMGEIGWEAYDGQLWTPDVPRSEAEHVRVRCFRSAVP